MVSKTVWSVLDSPTCPIFEHKVQKNGVVKALWLFFQVGKSHSALYHSACIWGVDMVASEGPNAPGTLLTCSSDDTVRMWHLKPGGGPNIYSNVRMFFMVKTPQHSACDSKETRAIGT